LCQFFFVFNWLAVVSPIPQHGLINRTPFPFLGYFLLITLGYDDHVGITFFNFHAPVVPHRTNENLLRVNVITKVLVTLLELAVPDGNFIAKHVKALVVGDFDGNVAMLPQHKVLPEVDFGEIVG
jgi:hypothetical protein